MKPRLNNRIKIFPIIILSLIFMSLHMHRDRVISGFDIARWYLNADLVIISSLIEHNTSQVRSIDTASTEGYSIKCDFLKDKYVVVIDSILKGCSFRDTIDIITPEYSINCYNYKITENSGIEVSANGDSTLLSSVEVIPYNHDSGEYYRLGAESKNVIFLKYDRYGYETIYVMRGVNDEDLKFLNEVEMKGEKYLIYSKQNDISGI